MGTQTAIHWERTPRALRLGLLLAIVCQVARIAIAVLGRGDHARGGDEVLASSLVQALWVSSDLLGLFGALELARRAPRAQLLVIGYALSLAMFLGWLVFDYLEMGMGSSILDWITRLRYVSFALNLVQLVAWSLLARSALWVVGVVVGGLFADLPPALDGVYHRIAGDSELTQQLVHALAELVMLGSMLAVAMGVPFERPVAPRLVTARAFATMATAAAIAGAAAVLEVWLDAGSPGLAALLSLVEVGAFVWLVIATLGAAGTTPGSWPLHVAAALVGAGAVLTALAASTLVSAARGAHVTFDEGAGRWLLALAPIAGLVLALAGLAQRGRARGADAAVRVASVAALVVVLAGGIGAGLAAVPLAVRVAALAIAYAAGAYGLRTAGALVGDGSELPTAILR